MKNIAYRTLAFVVGAALLVQTSGCATMGLGLSGYYSAAPVVVDEIKIEERADGIAFRIPSSHRDYGPKPLLNVLLAGIQVGAAFYLGLNQTTNKFEWDWSNHQETAYEAGAVVLGLSALLDLLAAIGFAANSDSSAQSNSVRAKIEAKETGELIANVPIIAPTPTVVYPGNPSPAPMSSSAGEVTPSPSPTVAPSPVVIYHPPYGSLPLKREILGKPLVINFLDINGKVLVSKDLILSKDIWLSKLEGQSATLQANASQGVNTRTVSVGDAIELVTSTARKNPNAFAVVIGVEQYNKTSQIPDVRYARRDAASVKQYLMGVLGVPEKNIVHLTDEQATLGAIQRTLSGQLASWVEQGKSDVYVYYAGHGAPDAETQSAYLVPYDGDPSYPGDTCYPVSTVYKVLARLKARSVTVMLDACFTGSTGRGETPQMLVSGARPLSIETKQMKPSAVPNGLAVFAAAKGTQMSNSDDKNQHGLFTYYLLRGLKGEADRDRDGQLEVQELHHYLQREVEKAARSLGREQTPQLLGDQGGRILIQTP